MHEELVAIEHNLLWEARLLPQQTICSCSLFLGFNNFRFASTKISKLATNKRNRAFFPFSHFPIWVLEVVKLGIKFGKIFPLPLFPREIFPFFPVGEIEVP
jgi:hypothetical protein